MALTRAEAAYVKLKESNNRLASLRTQAEKERIVNDGYANNYRRESVDRVLDYIRMEYRAGRLCDLEALLCHCQNKLNGNIDGIELTLEKGKPFEFKESDEE